MKIRLKIYLSYLAIIVFIFVTFTIIFYASFKNNIIEQVKTDNLKFARLFESFFVFQDGSARDLKNFELQFEAIDYKLFQDYITVINKDGSIEYTNKNLTVEARVKVMSFFEENKDLDHSFKIGELDGKPYLFTLYRSKSSSHFYVLIISNLERISIFQKRFFTLIFQIVIFTCFVAAIIGIFMSKRMIQGLLKLKEGIEQASSLNFSRKVEVYTKDEIGMIAHEFNKLIEKIDKYNKMQIEFLQNISHELKTPLTSIRGYAEMIKFGLNSQEKLEYATQRIIEHVDRLKYLINQIIDLTKIESLESYFIFEKANIEDIIFDAILSNEGFALSKNIEIIYEPKAKTEIICDKDKLKEAFSNLISNCIRYAKSKVVINVICQKEFFEITVEDDGEGFKDEEVDRIFEKFYKGRRGESGLGLSIAKAIIQKHGFSLEAENKYSGGARFIIKGKICKEQ